LAYTSATDSSGATVRVVRKIFRNSVYKLFLGLSKKNVDIKILSKERLSFLSAGENKDVFIFSYKSVPPSKDWEGLQGFIYLKKIIGKYFINGVDTVP
jgi:hypothetical protein